jgi:uncharacterized protein YdhG (YjbR/CyaY superfamily)
MAKTVFTSADEYIASQPKAMQPVLRLVRNTIRKAVPEAEEVISYQMPAFKLNGSTVLYFAGWKEHYSLYPGSGRFIAALKEELASCEVKKGTIRFPLSQPVPVKLIERIAKLRAKEVGEKKKATARP